MVAKEMKDSLVLSASRTKDLLRCCPDALAKVVNGERSCRFGFGRQKYILSPETIHTLVLWTKSVANMWAHEGLRSSLQNLIRCGGQIAVHLSVTGFGSSFIEWGIPTWQQAFAELEDVLAAKLTLPELVTLRYDPLLRLEYNSWTFSNCSMPLFEKIVQRGAELGVKRVVTSACDLSYQRAVKRMTRFEILPVGPSEEEATILVGQMATCCRQQGVDFSVCCYPQVDFEEFGCIDGQLYNSVSKREMNCTEVLHNKVGSQRPQCMCTHSRDIGYSKGFTHCFSQGAGCLYCYSQGATVGKMKARLKAELDKLRLDPSLLEKEPYLYLFER